MIKNIKVQKYKNIKRKEAMFNCFFVFILKL